MVGGAETKRTELPEASAGRSASVCRPTTGATRVAGAAVIGVNIGLTAAAMFAAFGMLPGNADAPLLTFLGWYVGLFAVLLTAGTLARAATPRDERRASCQNDLGFPRARLIIKYLWRGLPVVLLAGGHYGLAGLVAFLIGLGIVKRAEDRRILGRIEAVNPVSRAIHGAVFTVGELAAPVTRPVQRLLTWKIGDVPVFGILLVIVVLPVVLPLVLVAGILSIPVYVCTFLRGRTNVARHERELVRAAHAGGKLAWFAYAEPHQREHFLGKGGVLHEVADRVIVRDWRRDLRARAHGGDAADLEGVILNRLGLTSMRDDLPVLVFFEAHGRMAVYRLNRAYRMRLRDGGDLLAQLEEGMRLHFERAALPG